VAIKGITDAQRYAPRIGKIHLGIRKFKSPADKRGYPQATDYFVVPDEVKAVYGDQPKELSIMFLSNDMSVVLPHFYKLYGASTVAPVCKGDGVTAQRLDLNTGTRIEFECPGPKDCLFNRLVDGNGDVKSKGCQPTLNLMVNLPDLPGIGTYQIDSHSWNGLRELLNDIAVVQAALNGRIAFVPLKLRLMERDVDRQTSTGMVKKRVRYMHLTYEGTIRDLAKLPASLVPALHPGANGGTVSVPEPDETMPDDMELLDNVVEPENADPQQAEPAAQETPKTVVVPATRDQLAAIEQLAADKTADDFATLGIQSINVHSQPPAVSVDGKTLTIDIDYAALLIHQLQEGYAPMEPAEFARRFE
jgi:hypothetical protein